jgi:hypothetical protein
VLLVDVFLRQEQRHITYTLSMAALVGSAAFSAWFAVDQSATTFSESYVADPAGNALKMFAYLIVAIVFLYSRDYLKATGLYKGEFFVLGLFGLLGIMVMISANNLLIMYLGLELLALSLYTLVAFNRESTHRGRIGDEVLHTRRDRVRHAAVRHFAAVRPDRHDRTASARRRAGGAGRHHRADPAGTGVHHRRRRVQVRRGAVSHVAARRLSGFSHRGGAVRGLGAEDRRVRADLARSGGGAWARCIRAGRTC